jgi:hypothetical protein
MAVERFAGAGLFLRVEVWALEVWVIKIAAHTTTMAAHRNGFIAGLLCRVVFKDLKVLKNRGSDY